MKQVSGPVSTVFLPMIGVCLGVLDPRKKQISVYFGIGIVIFALYASLSLCQQLALKFIISPYCILFATPLEGNLEISVIDQTGRILLREISDNQTNIQLDCTALPQGMYTVRFSTAGETGVRKLVISK